MIKGITKRWMLNTLSVMLSIIVLIVVILILLISNLFTSQIQQDLHSASNELSIVFSGFRADNPTYFTSTARDYIENFDKKEQMGVMVLNSSGRVILTSTLPPDSTRVFLTSSIRISLHEEIAILTFLLSIILSV